jgi:metal-sulfur cluster biosynthetic enzyme
MTLTAIGCPLIDMIQSEIKDKITSLGIKENLISIEVTFDPPWTMEKMSKKGRAMLGI